MKTLCIIFKTAPHGNPNGREALDLALLSASFDQKVILIFSDEGVLNLVENQNPELIKAKDYIATFKALPLYEIDDIFVCQQSLLEFGLSKNTLNINEAQIADQQCIQTQLKLADEVLVF